MSAILLSTVLGVTSIGPGRVTADVHISMYVLPTHEMSVSMDRTAFKGVYIAVVTSVRPGENRTSVKERWFLVVDNRPVRGLLSLSVADTVGGIEIRGPKFVSVFKDGRIPSKYASVWPGFLGNRLR